MTGDSRTTTAPSPPGDGAVSALFGDRADLAVRFVGHLATSAVERGLVGPREVPRLWERHVLNCAAVAELVGPGARCVDVGSGAGLPGLALAIARPDLAVTLVEPLLRRVAWLEEVVADLGLANVEVVRARAEELHASGPRWDVATARAVAPLDRLARWCLPLVVPGGRLLALKGRSAEEEVEAARSLLTALGADAVEVAECGAGVLAEPTRVVVVTLGADGRAPAVAARRQARRGVGRPDRSRTTRRGGRR